jgi:hypothetical protein
MKVLTLVLLVFLEASTSFLGQLPQRRNPLPVLRNKLPATKKPYDVKEDKRLIYGLALAFVLTAKTSFMSKDLRTTYVCPYGYNAENVQTELAENQPGYKCKTAPDLLWSVATARLVFPGDPDFDDKPVRIEMIKVTRTGTGENLSK